MTKFGLIYYFPHEYGFGTSSIQENKLFDTPEKARTFAIKELKERNYTIRPVNPLNQVYGQDTEYGITHFAIFIAKQVGKNRWIPVGKAIKVQN